MKQNTFVLLGLFCLCLLSRPVFAAEENNPRMTPVVKVVKECGDSVVNISTESVALLGADPFWGQFHAFFDDSNMPVMPFGAMTLRSVGSGVVLSPEGLILTNAHVIQRANKIYVTLADQKQVEARPLSVNPNLDLALVKVDVPYALKPVKFAKDVIIGETVVAIGNPMGLQSSVSTGVVSSTHREIQGMPVNSPFKDLIQIDAPINPGNSGGGLFNLDGDFVGINVAIVQNAQGIGFVIPFSSIQAAMELYEKNQAQKSGNAESESPRKITVN